MSKERLVVKELLDKLGGRFSVSLGIDLESARSEEIFKWFLASILFGARIGEGIAINTYKEFERRGVLSPEAILETGWDGLVEILDVGGYVRYDFKTATKLLDIMRMLKEKYNGDLNNLHRSAKSSPDLEEKLTEFKGIGETTVNIFLRELRGIWERAEPCPSELVILGARNLGLIEDEPKKRRTLKGAATLLRKLKQIWFEAQIKEAKFADFESALLKLAKNYCRKNKCQICFVSAYCKRFG